MAASDDVPIPLVLRRGWNGIPSEEKWSALLAGHGDLRPFTYPSDARDFEEIAGVASQMPIPTVFVVFSNEDDFNYFHTGVDGRFALFPGRDPDPAILALKQAMKGIGRPHRIVYVFAGGDDLRYEWEHQGAGNSAILLLTRGDRFRVPGAGQQFDKFLSVPAGSLTKSANKR